MTVYNILHDFFLTNNESLEYLNVLLCIYFVSLLFKKVWCSFLDFAKGGRSGILKRFLAWNVLFFKILFFIIHLKWIKSCLLDSSDFIFKKVVHCFTLNLSLFFIWVFISLDAYILFISWKIWIVIFHFCSKKEKMIKEL